MSWRRFGLQAQKFGQRSRHQKFRTLPRNRGEIISVAKMNAIATNPIPATTVSTMKRKSQTNDHSAAGQAAVVVNPIEKIQTEPIIVHA